MLLNSLILLLLSNAITSRRDKSILYSRATITILLISAFISLILEWSMAHFIVLVLLTWAIISLLPIYNSSNKEFYYKSDMLAIFTGNYSFLVDKTISDSVYNGSFQCINIVIGLSMIIIGLLSTRNTTSIKDKFLFFMQNKEFIFISALVMLFVIAIVNILLIILGLGITVDTSSVTLFLYTFFPKLINIRLVLIFIICSITKEIKLDNFKFI